MKSHPSFNDIYSVVLRISAALWPLFQIEDFPKAAMLHLPWSYKEPVKES